MLREIIVKDNVIISTGGGTILKNEEILKKSYNILLHCELSDLIKRASRNKNRPLLSSNVENKMKDGIKLFGRTEYMTSVIFDGNIENIGKIVQVEITSSNQNSLFGKLTESSKKKVA